MSSLGTLADRAATWALLPLLALSALALTFVLRLPQFARVTEGIRALRDAPDPKAPGSLSPRTALALSMCATIGAGAVVSTATAISLGGAGALAWLWLFGLLLAPVRLAETLLTRSAPPGKAGQGARGSLAARLAHDSNPRLRDLGRALAVVVPLAGFLFVAGSHGTALADVAEELAPGSALVMGIAAAALALALVMVPRAREAIGWVGAAGLFVILLAAIIAIASAPGRAFGVIPRAIDDVFSGASDVGSFSGALVAEIFAAAVTLVLPPLVSSVGMDGALHGEARAPSAKVQASIAMLGVLGHVVLVTLVGMAIVGTGAFSRRTETERRLDEISFLDTPFETVSQRLETDRGWTGYVRIVDGELQGTGVDLATERGMIDEPSFTEADGSEGDFGARVRNGHINHLLRNDEDGVLGDVPLDGLRNVRVHGRMLPRGGALVVAALERGGGELTARMGLAALILLAALAAAAWGLGIQRILPKEVQGGAARIGVGLPALGLVLGASGLGPWLPALGTIAVTVAVVLSLLGVIGKARELGKL